MQSKHVETSICRPDLNHVENAMLTIWSIACGGMMYSMWKMPRKPCGEQHTETCCQTCGAPITKRVEGIIWKHDLKHVENASLPCGGKYKERCVKKCGEWMLTMWKKYSNHVEISIWRHVVEHVENACKPCGVLHVEIWFQTCGEFNTNHVE